MSDKRLIEAAFPLKQASIDSVHEKNVRHGHISTLHIWPARRPLAAARAALIATLLPDPGDAEQRAAILKRLGGTLVKTTKSKKQASGQVEDVAVEETLGGILHWGRESGPDLDWFREEIRKAYGGRAPKVLDPFAGGGAIPLEAMRLGCEVTAMDINPVAWFVLKCTLEYPQKLAGQTRRLPDFAVRDREFMAAYLKARGLTPATIRRHLNELGQAAVVEKDEKNGDMFGHDPIDPKLLDADLAWHVRAWGRWVLVEARKSLARFYPTYAEYCTLKPYSRVALAVDDGERLKRVPVDDAGEPQIGLLNLAYDPDYLENPKNPRWVMKPTVAYLWARTVRCKSCRATLPLLKTRWLCKKDHKRVVLTMAPNADGTGVVFGIDPAAKVAGGKATEKREHDQRLGAGTMSRAGAKCPMPGCGTIMTMEDIRLRARADGLGSVMTAVVVDGPNGKEYRLPTPLELESAAITADQLESVFAEIPFGLPMEPTPQGASRQGGGSPFTTYIYGLDTWDKLFTQRQLFGLGIFVLATRRLSRQLKAHGYPENWQQPIIPLIATAIDRLADYSSSLCSWHVSGEKMRNTFGRFALPIIWDFTEVDFTSEKSGGYFGAIEWIARYVEHTDNFKSDSPTVSLKSATQKLSADFDIVVTDPPYYDAIPYSDLMDFFYVWLRRTLHGLAPEFDAAFSEPLAPKWNHEANDGELIDDAARFGGDKAASKRNYEEGMARAFGACHAALKPDGRLVIVFAHKHPDAWETLVSAIIKAGFVVDASWPIQTEMGNRTRAISSAALSSSVWLVCKKRPPTAKAGWDNQVLADMETQIVEKLRGFWDAGIHGPDFVWAATGPALEAYSRYPAVKKTSESGLMEVGEFLRHVRRIVVDFVVGRVLAGDAAEDATTDHVLDNITSYYLLHRYDFGLKDAPAGACILYAVSCGLSERELTDQYELLARTGSGADTPEDGEGDDTGDTAAPASGGQFKLKSWAQRKHKNLGQDTAAGRPAPLIDQIHRLMHLWQAGDVVKVNDYLETRGLRRSRIFAQLLQALIELAPSGDAERTTLERLSNHVQGLGGTAHDSLILGETG